MKTICFVVAAAVAGVLCSCSAPAPAGDNEGGYAGGRQGRYYQTRPMQGCYVKLPAGARQVSHRGQVYYTFDNTWYQPCGNAYMIVERPD